MKFLLHQLLMMFLHHTPPSSWCFFNYYGAYMYSPQNRVIIRELEQENKTVGGIIISPTTADVDNIAKLGEVVVDAVGVVNDEKTGFRKGQRVYYSKFNGVKFVKDSEKYTSLAFSDIVAVVDD